MVLKFSEKIPEGVTFDKEGWSAAVKEVGTQYVLYFLAGAVVAAVLALSPLMPAAFTFARESPLPGGDAGFVGLAILLIAMFAFWNYLNLRLTKNICVEIAENADPVADAADSLKFVYRWVAFFTTAWFGAVFMGAPVILAAIPILVEPFIIGPAYMMAGIGAKYYAKHAGTNADAEVVCRTLYERCIAPAIWGAAVLFAGIVAILTVWVL